MLTTSPLYTLKLISLKTVFLPKQNEKDIEEVPNDVKKELKIVYVENYENILNYVIIIT